MLNKAVLLRAADSELWWSLKKHPLALTALLLLVLIVTASFAAPLIAPQNPYDLAVLNLDNAELPPIWQEDGRLPYLLGTDTQGRDLLSAILYGSRISVIIGLASVLLSMAVGLSLGLIAGYFGGLIDNLLMRIGDILLSIPTILIAILVSAVFRELLPAGLRETFSALILVLAISLTAWVQYARTVRASTMVERGKEYVLAAQLIKVRPRRIMLAHILPNTLTPIMVAATLNFGLAILIEATLSFL
ncbi:MAG: ABC transporter permease, partial [Candidatus Competibacteraceae bacterium]|nr:ABC transporter permease [Candidatus Competibacteraceae bacterium]